MDIEVLTPKFFALNCKFIASSMTYEHYLIEVVNGSLCFFNQFRSPFEQFRLQKNQSNGEDDVFSSRYSMDFKLLVDQDVMNAMAKNKPDVDYSHKKEGFISVHEKNDKTPVPNKNILLELMALQESDLKSDTLNSSVVNILKYLRKNKNLFIYYPYEFLSKENHPGQAFVGVLNIALNSIMEYRVKEQPDNDTFLCIKANQWFLIYEWTSNGFVFRDSVHEMLCGNYRDARLYSLY